MASITEIESLLIRIVGDGSAYKKALDDAAKHTDTVAKKIEKNAAAFKSAGKKLTAGITLPVIGLGLAATKVAADFDQSMREVNSLIGLSGSEFADLKKEVKGVSAELGLGLQNSAAAAYQAISAGVPREELQGFLRVAGKAAKAGVTDVETAVDGLTTVLNAFKMETADTEKVADILFTGVKRGKTTMEELSRSLFQAAPLAATLGVSLEEVTAMTASLTKSGTPTSVAMTQIRQSMVALTKPNEDMVKLLKAAGIQSAEASIKSNGLVKTYQKLLGVASGSQLSAAVGSVEALQAVLGVTGGNSDMFAEDLAATQDAAGSMEAAYGELSGAANSSIKKIMATIEALADTIGNMLLPIITPWADKLREVLDRVSTLDPKLVKLGVIIAGVAAAVGPLLLGIGLVAGAFASIGTVLSGVVAIITGPVVIAIAVLTGATILIIRNWEKVKAFFIAAFMRVKKAFTDWASSNEHIINRVKTAFEDLKNNASRAWTALVVAVRDRAQEFIAWLDKFLEPIGGLAGAWEIMKASAVGAMNVITNTLSRFIEFASGIFANIAEFLEGNISIWDLLVRTVKGAFDLVWETLKDITTRLLQLWVATDWGALGKAIIDGIVSGIKSGAASVVNAAKSLATDALDGAKNLLGIESPSKEFKKVGQAVGEGFALGVEGMKNRVAGAVRNTFGLSALAGRDLGDFGSIAEQYIPQDALIKAKFASERNAIIKETRITEQQRSALLVSSERALAAELLQLEEERMQDQVERQTRHFGFMDNALSNFATRTTELLTGAGNQWKSFGGVVKSVIGDLGKQLVGSGLKSLTGGFGNALGNILGSFGGGPTNKAAWGLLGGLRSVLGFADGGRPPVGRVSVVGEQGPELFVPDRPGTIVPNGGFAGGGGPVVNQYFSGGVQESDLANWAQIIKKETIEGFLDSVNRGGNTRKLVQA